MVATWVRCYACSETIAGLSLLRLGTSEQLIEIEIIHSCYGGHGLLTLRGQGTGCIREVVLDTTVPVMLLNSRYKIFLQKAARDSLKVSAAGLSGHGTASLAVYLSEQKSPALVVGTSLWKRSVAARVYCVLASRVYCQVTLLYSVKQIQWIPSSLEILMALKINTDH